MKVIELTRGEVAVVDDEDFDRLAQYRWRCSSRGYAVRGKRTIRMHREIMNPPEGMEVDHINGNTLDNRRSNLRLATRSQNAQNTRFKNSNISGEKGVHWDRSRSKYRARICTNGTRRHLGLFDSVEDAKRAYDEAAIKYHGEFARLN